MTEPFYMSIDQISNLNFNQINSILEEHNRQIERKHHNLKRMLKELKGVYPMFDITRLED